MASADEYVAAQNGAVRRAVADLRALWGRLDLDNGPAVRLALEELWPRLLAQYGEITATIAADRFEDLTGLPAVLADPLPNDQVNARMRWGLSPLFGGEGQAAAFGLLAGLADEIVKQLGRNTMIGSADRNGIRFARVPSGAETCAFCLMTASRGAVYLTQAKAGKGDKFHGDCDCRVEPVRRPSDLDRLRADGYDLEALRDIYANAEGRGTKQILSSIRSNEGIH